ncbi:hypothetical protein SAMN02744787_1245 [Bacillus subtilis]|uniref:hypothetical protein n=1 Tax=Bacillus TaxID=1386 RepID=UPI000A08C366|nr:hypothetical protein [Bacillus subtilis]MDH3148774.1 hypothetical protein [Bacillus subtilis]MDI6685911.1 hypothetical protein [Bacillus subtilis]MEC0294762.1 hypothetical protein [Bacillus subtilis]MEC0337700.1 hypothetical protein [Bacillus subtilis]MEC2268596.1 hypothetical protein [Bacillus subtilis]
MTINKKVFLSLILLGVAGTGIVSSSVIHSKDLAIDRNTTLIDVDVHHDKNHTKYYV